MFFVYILISLKTNTFNPKQYLDNEGDTECSSEKQIQTFVVSDLWKLVAVQCASLRWKCSIFVHCCLLTGEADFAPHTDIHLGCICGGCCYSNTLEYLETCTEPIHFNSNRRTNLVKNILQCLSLFHLLLYLSASATEFTLRLRSHRIPINIRSCYQMSQRIIIIHSMSGQLCLHQRQQVRFIPIMSACSIQEYWRWRPIAFVQLEFRIFIRSN